MSTLRRRLKSEIRSFWQYQFSFIVLKANHITTDFGKVNGDFGMCSKLHIIANSAQILLSYPEHFEKRS